MAEAREAALAQELEEADLEVPIPEVLAQKMKADVAVRHPEVQILEDQQAGEASRAYQAEVPIHQKEVQVHVPQEVLDEEFLVRPHMHWIKNSD